MKIAIAGKGGTGKTTISGTLARALAQSGRPVWAVDADTNPNLEAILGTGSRGTEPITGLPREIIERRDDGTVALNVPADELVERFGTVAPDGIGFLLMGRVNHAGAG